MACCAVEQSFSIFLDNKLSCYPVILSSATAYELFYCLFCCPLCPLFLSCLFCHKSWWIPTDLDIDILSCCPVFIICPGVLLVCHQCWCPLCSIICLSWRSLCSSTSPGIPNLLLVSFVLVFSVLSIAFLMLPSLSLSSVNMLHLFSSSVQVSRWILLSLSSDFATLAWQAKTLLLLRSRPC